MIIILSGTDRPQSRSLEIAKIIKPMYQSLGIEAEIMSLADLKLDELQGSHYGNKKPLKVEAAIEKLLHADGLVVICPEYNGSMPGALKLFIDHWKYPESFEYRPVCFIGLGGRFGGLRPVEHLQQVFGYRNAFVFPLRVFLQNVWNVLKDEKLLDEEFTKLLEKQAQDFSRFIKALKSEKIHGKDYILEN